MSYVPVCVRAFGNRSFARCSCYWCAERELVLGSRVCSPRFLIFSLSDFDLGRCAGSSSGSSSLGDSSRGWPSIDYAAVENLHPARRTGESTIRLGRTHQCGRASERQKAPALISGDRHDDDVLVIGFDPHPRPCLFLGLRGQSPETMREFRTKLRGYADLAGVCGRR